jgi:branched-chain amino acid transport system ATP-binding protein
MCATTRPAQLTVQLTFQQTALEIETHALLTPKSNPRILYPIFRNKFRFSELLDVETLDVRGAMRAVASESAGTVILSANRLVKEFRGFIAVNELNLQVREGTIHALIGPNGAGKTTVFNLLTKVSKPTRGEIHYRGRDITGLSPARVARLGIVRSFQISAVFPHMTVLDNVRVALQRKAGLATQWWKSDLALDVLDQPAFELLESVELTSYAHKVAAELSYGRKRALEIATTLALQPDLLLLDEPMAGMGHEDIDRVTRLIRTVAKGRTVLMVEHNLKVVAELCDKITVLARGQVLAEGSYADVSADPKVREAYLGREAA